MLDYLTWYIVIGLFFYIIIALLDAIKGHKIEPQVEFPIMIVSITLWAVLLPMLIFNLTRTKIRGY